MPVPYPVQIVGTELLMEFIGTDDEHGTVAAAWRGWEMR